jgi:thiol-disulfide isomerase/thioredoxin
LVPAFGQMTYRVDVSFTDPYNTNGGVKNGDVVKLKYSFDNVEQKAVVKDGKATFTGMLAEPTVAMLNYKSGGVKLLLDGSDYTLTFTVAKRGEHFGYDHVLLTNSQFHKLWEDFYENNRNQTKRKLELLDQIDGSQDEAQANALRRELALLDLEIADSYKKVALTNPDNHAVAYFMGESPDFSYKNYMPIYSSLDEKVKNSQLGRRMLGKLEAVKGMYEEGEIAVAPAAKAYIGRKIPEITGVTETGESVRLSPVYPKSRYTLIEFWASWCGPCRKINVDMRAKYAAYKKQGLEIIGFSLDADADNWKKAVAKDKTGWLQVSDLKAAHSPVAQFFNLEALPANVVVDAEGTIVAMDVYGEALEKLLREGKAQ